MSKKNAGKQKNKRHAIGWHDPHCAVPTILFALLMLLSYCCNNSILSYIAIIPLVYALLRLLATIIGSIED